MGVNRQLQAKTPKYNSHHISENMNSIKTEFEDQAETNNYTSWVLGGHKGYSNMKQATCMNE